MKTMFKGIIRILTVILIIISMPIAQAGFWALPLEAELDLAQRVVVGKITKIEVTKTEYDGKMQSGTATITVEDTLKGSEEKTVTISVVTHRDREITEKMQSPSRSYKIGNEGIWVIMEGNKPSHGYGLLERSRLDEIKKNLKMLDERKWSEEVNGIKVWTGTVNNGVIFAVKNVSDKTIYLPRSSYSGLVTITIEDKNGKQTILKGMGMQGELKENPACKPLEPNQTRYMHWDSENYGNFIIPKNFTPGEYTVHGALYNDKTTGSPLGALSETRSLWTGKISSPDVILTLNEKTEKDIRTEP